MANEFLVRLIPESNSVSLLPMGHGKQRTTIIEEFYNYVPAGVPKPTASNFVGVFMDRDDMPRWSRQVAQYLQAEFREVAGPRYNFAAIESALRAGDGKGECHVHTKHAFKAWRANGKKGPKPFSRQQDYGSCVPMSKAEHCAALAGFRICAMGTGEVWGADPSCLDYGNRGYCRDGWNFWGLATVAKKLGVPFRQKYVDGSNSVDLTDEDDDENFGARGCCSRGVPGWLASQIATAHPWEDGAIVEFQGGRTEALKSFAEGAVIQTSGTRTSGGSVPFMVGSVGPHMQSLVGLDDTDACRRWFSKWNLVVGPNDSVGVLNQTWGPGWRGECAPRYWPYGTDASGKIWSQEDVTVALAGGATPALIEELERGWGWGEMPEGAWVWLWSQIESRLSCDGLWFPRFKGFAGTAPPPPDVPPPPTIPRVDGRLYIDKNEIRGIVKVGGFRYTAKPAGGNAFSLEPVIL